MIIKKNDNESEHCDTINGIMIVEMIIIIIHSTRMMFMVV